MSRIVFLAITLAVALQADTLSRLYHNSFNFIIVFFQYHFKVAPGTIRKDLMKIRKELGHEIADWSLEDVLGDMVHSAEKYSAMAIKQEDNGLAWTIKRDLYKMLREFGVIQSEGQQSFTVTIETIGKGYERAASILGQQLDPLLVLL